MALDIAGIYDQVVTHAESLGVFERVITFEPKAAPGSGLTAVIYMTSLRPVALMSGLAASAARLELRIRIHQNMLTEPQDDVDKTLLAATAALMGAYIGDFELGGEATSVDVFGAYGDALGAESGYVRQDSAEFRVSTITLPIIVDDVWGEVA